MRAHYDALDWPSTILFGWVAGDALRGLVEVMTWRASMGMLAEIAVSVERGWRERGIGSLLVAHATQAAARRGIGRSLMLLHHEDCAHARIMRRLGAALAADGETAILCH
ncbi:MAG: hypothetical protein NVSMB18_19220 [Acetobacteraceae bacterium]